MNEVAEESLVVVGIGASAGGIKALKEFFAAVPPDIGVAFVVIIHLSENHPSSLAEILQSVCSLKVSQVCETSRVEANHVYVIPPTRHLMMTNGFINLADREKPPVRRAPIDLFFRTLADAYGKNAYAIILSGAGDDGTMGVERIKEEGGVTMAQDPTYAEYSSMPVCAIATNLVDFILPASSMPGKIAAIRNVESHLINIAGGSSSKEVPGTTNSGVLRDILTLVRLRTGHDFANYKRPTLIRRVARRLQVHEMTEVGEYLRFLREHPEEVQRLLRDLLITVTNFFRDPESFKTLELNIIPKLFNGKTSKDHVRVWSCGCGTGEEAYSLGMLLHEYAAGLPDPPRIQIFASDINDDAIRIAREGSYSLSIASDVTPERLSKFFTKKADGYQVTKMLRESVLFAPHNVLRDPPFSQLDLIACRNLLIYLNRDTQERVMELFSFALNSGSFLFLGSSEAAESSDTVFLSIDKKHRIYKNIESSKRRTSSAFPAVGQWEVNFPDHKSTTVDGGFSFAALHFRVAERFAPPSILINEDYDIVHTSDRAGRYLRIIGGEPTRNLLKTIDPALQLDARAALMAAKQEDRQTEFRNVTIKLDNEERMLNLVVRPIVLPDTASKYFLMIFEDERQSHREEVNNTIFEALAGDVALESVVRRLEDELQQTKDTLRLTVEHSEVSTEELKASNEELQAINEELRSATEELETSKEELQSVNEELTTVNNELKDKVIEVSRVNSDLQNLMHSTDIGTIFLDRKLSIKRYTRRIENLFNIIHSDVGRPFEHLTHKFDYNKLTEDCDLVLKTLAVVERELKVTSSDSCYLARISPYRTLDDRIDGVVISFVDISELKRTTDRLKLAQEAAKG